MSQRGQRIFLSFCPTANSAVATSHHPSVNLVAVNASQASVADWRSENDIKISDAQFARNAIKNIVGLSQELNQDGSATFSQKYAWIWLQRRPRLGSV